MAEERTLSRSSDRAGLHQEIQELCSVAEDLRFPAMILWHSSTFDADAETAFLAWEAPRMRTEGKRDGCNE